MRKTLRSERFEARLQGSELELAHHLMIQAGFSKKAEFTRASILAGVPGQAFLTDNLLGELAMAANRLAHAIATVADTEEQRRLGTELKRLIKAVHRVRVADRQVQEGRQ